MENKNLVEIPIGFTVAHLTDWYPLTDEVNAETRYVVERNATPYCGENGVRRWAGPTLQDALNAALVDLEMQPIIQEESDMLEFNFRMSAADAEIVFDCINTRSMTSRMSAHMIRATEPMTASVLDKDADYLKSLIKKMTHRPVKSNVFQDIADTYKQAEHITQSDRVDSALKQFVEDSTDEEAKQLVYSIIMEYNLLKGEIK